MEQFRDSYSSFKKAAYQRLNGASKCLLLLLSSFSAIHGLIAIGVIFPTLDLLVENELYFKVDNEPYTYASIECFLAGLSFLIGMFVGGLTLAGSEKSKNPTSIKAGMVFYGVLAGVSIIYTMLRASKLGVIYEISPVIFSNKSTCYDTAFETGCPTARFKYKTGKKNLQIDYDVANGNGEIGEGGETGKLNKQACTFNAFEVQNNTVKKYRYDYVIPTTTPPTAEFRLDYSDFNVYDKVYTEGSALGNLKDAAANRIFLEQNSDGTCEKGKAVAANTAPYTSKRCQYDGGDLADITWCWHWGCDNVCNEERYKVNRIWLYVSFASTGSYLLLMLFSGLTLLAVEQEQMSSEANKPEIVGPSPFKSSYRYKRVNFDIEI